MTPPGPNDVTPADFRRQGTAAVRIMTARAGRLARGGSERDGWRAAAPSGGGAARRAGERGSARLSAGDGQARGERPHA